MPHLEEGSSIINTTSINAFKGNASLVPYTATKGAEVGLHALLGWTMAGHQLGYQCDTEE
jgi:NAD(P)-dependent dehydrogenase (short-subunit alcohol dehydrogenase family)